MVKRRTRAKVVLFFLSATMSLFFLEFAYRFYVFGRASFSVQKMNSFHHIGKSGLLQTSSDKEIVYELKPNLRAWFKLTPFETNSCGLRDRERAVAKPDHTFRVAVVGDSFTMPAGVRIEEAYHALLEDHLNRQARGRRYECLNFGVGGYCLRQYVAVIRNKAPAYHPDLILIGFCSLNDHQLPDTRLYDSPYKVLRPTHPFFSHPFVLNGVRGLLMRNRWLASAGSQVTLSREEEQYVSDMFTQIGAFSRATRIPVVVAYLGIWPTRCDRLEQIVTANGIRFVNLTAAFQGTKPEDYLINTIDQHPNGKANRIFADRLYEYLEANRLIPD